MAGRHHECSPVLVPEVTATRSRNRQLLQHMLADEILTDGFVTETEPLMLNASPKEIQQLQEGWAFIPPWGETVNGNRTLRPFSLCHHKSAARVITLHLIVNVFLEDLQQCF